jgi:hypothetical protein
MKDFSCSGLEIPIGVLKLCQAFFIDLFRDGIDGIGSLVR